MGSEQSRTEEENRREGEILDLEKSIKERNYECEISLMNRLLELQLDAAKDMKEKANYFDTKVSTLEVENMNLKMNVAVLAGKIEKLENEKLLNAEDFEIRIKHLEPRGIVSMPTPPQFQETIRVYKNSSSSPQLFPKPRQPGVTVAPFKKDVISMKPASVKTSLPNVPQYWSDGFPTVSLSVNVDFQPFSEVAPGSWLTDSSQLLPTEVLNQFRQNKCELCSATLQTESVARSHYKGKRHLSNVEQLQKSPDDVLNTSDEILYHHGDLLSSVDGKEIVTLDENCNELDSGSTVFIGCDVLGEVKESIIQEVFIINHDGVPLFDGDVSRIIDAEETSSNAIGPCTNAKVSELEKFQSRLKDVLSSKMLIGFNLGHKLKALKMDHPEHRTREINQPFQGFKPSMRWILKTSLNISEFQHSKEFEAECAMAVFKKKGSSWEYKKKVAEVECRILMPPSASTITTKLHKEKKLKGLGLDSPCVSVVSFRSSDVGSVVKSLLEFLRHVNYGQEIEASELKMIVPSTLELKQEDLASCPVVALYKILLPKSKEKVVGFGGNHDDMVSGVFQCLTLMVKNECCYEGLGSRYDSSDHDEETVAQYGGWSVENFQDEHQKEAEVKCRSCSVFGAENFSLSQLMKEDNERKCTNCISLSELLCI